MVIEEAARLLGMEPPPEVPFEVAVRSMSADGPELLVGGPQGRQPQDAGRLGLRWRYPTYREGLRAILAAERAEQCVERPGQQG